MAALHNSHCCAHPGRDLFLYFSVAPVAHCHFALNTHAGYDMTILSVTMGRLIFIHKVHVNGIVRNLLIELGVQMHQRLSVLLQSQDPGFGR